MRNSQPQSLDLLFKETTLVTIKERGSALSMLNGLLHKYLPDGLAQQCRIINYRQGILIIGVSSASWLTRLRYEQEKLRSQLRQNGLSGLSSILFKVNPELNVNKLVLHSPENSAPKREITAQSAQYLLALADNCSPGLKNRLINLANHVAKTDNE